MTYGVWHMAYVWKENDRLTLRIADVSIAGILAVFEHLQTNKWRKKPIISSYYMYRPVVTICTAQWSLYVPPVLTFNISTLCPHNVFMCFVWISEQTAIISLFNINWLVCITETQCVYCAVRTGFLTTEEVNLNILRLKKTTPCPET